MKLAEFFAMGGYGFYIWGSYGMTALLLVVEIYLVRWRRRTILSRLSRISRMKTMGVNDEAQA